MKKITEKNTIPATGEPVTPILAPAPSATPTLKPSSNTPILPPTSNTPILPPTSNTLTLTPTSKTPTPIPTSKTPTLEPPFDAVNCPVRQVLDRFGDKWSILVIILLGDRGKLRFNELSNAIGDISQKMLTVTLRSLEADGLATRKMYPEIPPRVEYDLTPLAQSLLPLIKDMVKWADANIEEIKDNRRRHAERAPSKT